jgi:hypothetical protein
MRLERVVPEPDQVFALEDRIVFVILGAPGGRVPVRLTLEPGRVGGVDARLGVAGGPSAAFGHFVYP